ncbi:neprilysin-1-like [Haemaphysalis longicornis]
MGLRRRKAISGLISTGFVSFIVSLPLLVYWLQPRPPGPKVAYCETDICQEFGLTLKASINTSVDPCDNFYYFVCGSRDDPKRRDTEDNMTAASYERALAQIAADKRQQSEATRFYHSCYRPRANETAENIAQFLAFKKRLGLVWPEKAPTDQDPLSIMVDLAINWDMNFLFDISVVGRDRRQVLLFNRGRLGFGWKEYLEERPQLDYKAHVKRHYDIMAVHESRVKVSDSQLRDIESRIIEAKLDAMYGTPEQNWSSLGDLDSWTPSVRRGQTWLDLIAKHDKQFQWSATSTVITEDYRIFQNLDALLKNRSDLVVGLSWIFVQTHLWIVSDKVSIRFPAASVNSQAKKYACLEYVDSRLGLLSVSKTMEERFGQSDRVRNIDSFIVRVKEAAQNLLGNLTWIGQSVRKYGSTKLGNITRRVLPDQDFYDARNRELMYRQLPKMNDTFMGNLLRSSDFYRERRKDERFEDVYSARWFPRFGREIYLHLPNLLKVAIGITDMPLYHNDATLAIRYGGFGGFVARSLSYAFDETGITVGTNGERVEWWGKSAEYASKVKCDVRSTSDSPTRRPVRLFPGVPGVEVAFAGYKVSVSSDFRELDDFRVRHLEQFKDDQVFFLAYCYALCSRQPRTTGEQCNVPLKNIRVFAAAFNCPQGSAMNPPNKCSFFDL